MVDHLGDYRERIFTPPDSSVHEVIGMECFRIDESGYTDYDLLNHVQPFQGASAIGIEDEDAARLIRERLTGQLRISRNGFLSTIAAWDFAFKKSTRSPWRWSRFTISSRVHRKFVLRFKNSAHSATAD